MVRNHQQQEPHKGYKQSDIGQIPEDWEVTTLGSCLKRSPEYGINAPSVAFSDALPTYIRITDVTEDGRFDSEGKVSVDSPMSERFYLDDGDIVLARTGASVGKSYLYDKKDGPLVFAGFLIRVKPDPDKLVPGFLSNYLTTSRYWNWVRLMSARTGQPGINGNEYAQLPLPLPHVSEQRAITSTLNTLNDTIESLRKLITKKRAIKHGAMQELLSGKRRLPGFSGTWGYISIEEIAQKKDHAIVDGPFGSQMKVAEFVDEGIPVVEMEHLENRQNLGMINRYISLTKFRDIARSAIYPRDILISKTGTLGLLGLVPESIPRAMITSRLAKISIDESKANISFAFHWLRNLKLTGYWEKVSQGGTMQILGISMLKRAPFPDISVAEQQGISSLLNSMDEEVDAMVAHRIKLESLRKGMIQTLLTGKIRLLSK